MNQNQTTQPACTNETDGAVLLDATLSAVTRHVVFPNDGTAIAVTLWIAATYGVSAWNNAPRLIIHAPEKRCGKTRLLALVEALTHNPVPGWNATPRALLRIIDQAKNDPPTLLFDEADTIYRNDLAYEDLQSLLNGGYDRGRPFLRYDAVSEQVEQLPTFAMAALASSGPLPTSITGKAVNIRMKQASGQTVDPYRRSRDLPPLTQLGEQLNHWVRTNQTPLTEPPPDMGVEDRQADIWEPLIAIADLAGNYWPDLARRAATEVTNQTPV